MRRVSYSATEAARQSGLTYRQLDHLCRHAPELGQPTGSGTRRSFEDEDLPVLTALRRLRDLGADIDELRRVLAVLQRPVRPQGWLVVTATRVAIVGDLRGALTGEEAARVVSWDASIRRRRGVA